MAGYSIAQIAYAGKGSCLTPYIGDNTSNPNGILHPENILGSADPVGPLGTTGKAPYQQIILNGGAGEGIEFKKNIPYYLNLTLPRNSNYDLDFALLLIGKFGENGEDLDQLEYQFLRYIHVPRAEKATSGQSYVILYELPQLMENQKGWTWGKDDTTVECSIAYPYPEGESTDNDKIYYEEKNGITNFYHNVQYGDSGDSRRWTLMGQWFEIKDSKWNIRNNVPSVVPEKDLKSPKETYTDGDTTYKFIPIGKNISILSYTWRTEDTAEQDQYEVIFKPRVDGMYYLYLYLIPKAYDNDIIWLNETKPGEQEPFYGRHINLNNVKVQCYQIKNLIPSVTGNDGVVKRFGIWGRSELLFTVNGEEIRIGPSGYYELQNFDTTYLGVVAQRAQDQFTIDIQY